MNFDLTSTKIVEMIKTLKKIINKGTGAGGANTITMVKNLKKKQIIKRYC